MVLTQKISVLVVLVVYGQMFLVGIQLVALVGQTLMVVHIYGLEMDLQFQEKHPLFNLMLLVVVQLVLILDKKLKVVTVMALIFKMKVCI